MNLWLLISVVFIASSFEVSQGQECWCGDLCSTVQAHEFILEGTVNKISQDAHLIKYRILVHSNLKGKTSTMIWVYALPNDPCLAILKKKQNYLLFLVQQDNEFWLSSCFNLPWVDQYKETVTKCFGCPLLKCKECANGNVLDSNGCRTCACKDCPNGEPFVQCFVQPCSLQETQCPQAASCVDDYCGGCNAHYFDESGNEICAGCPDVMCAMYCENGFKTDENGCEICECNECPKGEPPVECFVEPCSLQKTECPQAASCVDDYCGGCNAHYFDESGNEICHKCPEVRCFMYCENGFQTDENGCEICKCNECPNGEPLVQCFVEPCALQPTECPEAVSCVDDYCGGCNAHYFDESGNEICQGCKPVTCKMFCKYGWKIDENGCEICACNECPGGEPPVQCFVEPCSLQKTECPQAASCVDDYCGGCNAHYFDESGKEICTGCPDVMCAMYCENGFKTDENGCEICECNECSPVRCLMFCEHGFKTDENGCEMCECNECPNGERPVECLVEPCSLQAFECPQAASCVNDYCGDCEAHYFDEWGAEICTGCPEVTCALYCEYGFQTNEDGCPVCRCIEPSESA